MQCLYNLLFEYLNISLIYSMRYFCSLFCLLLPLVVSHECLNVFLILLYTFNRTSKTFFVFFRYQSLHSHVSSQVLFLISFFNIVMSCPVTLQGHRSTMCTVAIIPVRVRWPDEDHLSSIWFELNFFLLLDQFV